MHENVESKLGYDRIRLQAEAHCTTTGGREKLRAEGFSSDAASVQLRLRLAGQMRTVLAMEAGFPGGDYVDLVHIVRKGEVEGMFLDPEELLTLRSALDTADSLMRFFKTRDEGAYPDLVALGEGVETFPRVVARIDAIVDRHGVVRDNASPELYAIRRAIREREGQVAKKLRRILAEAQSSGIVDADATVSVRDGRAVIPVSATNKRKLKGLIQDESATGRTFYVEPAEIVEMNNELRELEYDQRREVVRILTEFTDAIRPDLPGIERSGDYLTTIDMIRAKARFASENRCVEPLLSQDGTLELRSARHPLLEQALKREGRQIVPLDITLTRQKRILVISGPNAGGKSVCLKTTGLLQWMFQCGMPVPALENSQLPLFDAVFIDIGDQQSIDNDLSTYSSHLLNLKGMLREAGARSLVLIDEFGSGTEPVIGGAIAEAILERFEQKSCYGVITTHYSNLKYYASNAEGVANGAMMFDVQNIRPLFRLEIGTPGSSFAVEIARKIGLPEEIIRAASEKAGSDHVNIERQLREIARDRRYWEQKRDRIRVADRKVEELERKYSEQLSAIREQRVAILKEAKTEAGRITAEANKQIENAIKTIRESQADREQTRLIRKNIDDFRASLSDEVEVSPEEQDRIEREMARVVDRRRRREERKAQRGAEAAEMPAPPVLKVPQTGSKVRIEGQQAVGEVQSVKGKKATVAFGQVLSTVDIDRLEVVPESEYRKHNRPQKATINLSSDVSARKLRFRDSIDVRGMRVEEALDEVRELIDDAIMVGAGRVSILHGKGTGALKEEIRRYLGALDVVASAVDEHVEAGGAGITVVKLDA